MIEEKEELNHQGKRMKAISHDRSEAHKTIQKGNITAKSIFYSQTINFNERDHKDGRSPLHWVHEVKSAFHDLNSPTWQMRLVVTLATQSCFGLKGVTENKKDPVWNGWLLVLMTHCC